MKTSRWGRGKTPPLSRREPNRWPACHRSAFGLSCLSAAVWLAWGIAPAFALDPNALPAGGSIVAGQGSITQSGATMQINQAGPRLAADWKSFNIGANAAVTFNQPNASAVALNRVVGADPSQIFGRLSANGQVFLLNPNGVIFGPTARVDVGGLVATTLKLSNEDFLAGRYAFARDGLAGRVMNQGTLNAAEGGYIALLAPEVRNEGVILARLGTAALAAGDAVSLDFAGDGLIRLTVERGALDAQVANRHLIVAEGGTVLMSARAANTIAGEVVNNSGVIEAKSLISREGRIFLDGGEAGEVRVSGTLDASGAEVGAKGGAITVLGEKVGLMAGARLDVSGETGGGTVLVGGNWQGQGPQANAKAVYMDKDASIKADATRAGDGGKAVLWSDDYTGFYGAISARGGSQSGNGGEVETSSHNNLQAFGTVNAAAPNGRAGSWLLDPADVTISTGATSGGTFNGGTPTDTFTPTATPATVNATTLVGSLNAGTNVLVTTTCASCAGNGDITLSTNLAPALSLAATLTLQADRHIVLGTSTITATGAALGVVLSAGNGGSGNISGTGTITTNSGAFTATTPWGNISLGAVTAGTGAVTVRTGPSSGTAVQAGSLAVGAVTGGAVSIKDTLTGSGSTVSYTSLSANGDVDVWQSLSNADINVGTITQNSSSATTTTIKSGRSIVMSGTTYTVPGTGAASLIVDTHYLNDTGNGSFYLSAGTINTKGGNITIGGGSNPAVLPAIGITAEATVLGRGVMLANGTGLAANGGSILINGQGASPSVAGDSPFGIDIIAAAAATSITTTGTGTITLTGAGGLGAAGTNAAGISFTKSSTLGITVSTGTGAITLNGTGGTAGGQKAGIWINNSNATSSVSIWSTGGAVTLNGTALDTAASAILTAATGVNNIGWDGAANVTTGNVALRGQTPGGSTAGNAGISLAATTVIKGNGGNLTIGSTGNGLSGFTLANGNVSVASVWNNVTLGDANAAYVNITGGTYAAAGTGTLTIAAGGTYNGVAGAGQVQITGSTLATAGGALTLSNSSQGATTNNGGVMVNNSTVNANGGNISITGYGGGSSTYRTGVWLDGATTNIQTTGAGTITITGTGVNANSITSVDGIWLHTGTISIFNTGSGAITLTGTQGAGTGLTYGTGIESLNNGTVVKIYSTSGNITLTGKTPNNANAVVYLTGVGANSNTTYIGWDGTAANGTTGNIAILGETPTTSTAGTGGIQLGNTNGSVFQVKGSGSLTIGNSNTGLSNYLSGMTLSRSGATVLASGQTFTSITLGNNGAGATGTMYVYGTTAIPFQTSGTGAITLATTGNATQAGNITVDGASLTTAGGAISITSNTNGYIYLLNSPALSSNGGDITVANTSAASGNAGLYATGATGVINAGTGGNITLSGTSTAQEGIEFATAGWKIYTGTGAIALSGATSLTNYDAIYIITGVATNIGWNGAGAGTTGAISLLGATPTTSTQNIYGIDLGGAAIKGSGSFTIGNLTSGTSYLSGLYVRASNIASGSVFSSISLGNNGSGGTGTIQIDSVNAFATSGTGAISLVTTGNSTQAGNININGSSTFTTAGGAISIASNTNGYIYLQASPTFVSNGGNITIANTSAASGNAGIWTSGAAGVINASKTAGTGGNITLSGTSTAQEGIDFSNAGWKIYTNGGNVSVTGATSLTNYDAIYFDTSAASYLGWDGSSAGTTGNISILGSTPTGSTQGNFGIDFGGLQIRGSGALTIGNVASGYLSGFLLRSVSSIYPTASFSSITLGSNNGGTTGGLSSNGTSVALTTSGGAITIQTANSAGNGIALSSSALTSNGGAISVTADAGQITTGTINASAGNVTILAGPSSGTAGTTGAINLGAITGAVISAKNMQTGSGSSLTTGAITAAGNAIAITASDTNTDVTLGAISQSFATANTLTAKSGRNIFMTGAFANALAGKTTIVLDAHYTNDTNIGSVYVSGNISTKGGNLTIGGGADPTVTKAIGGYNASTNEAGVAIQTGVIVDALGGNIIINGQGGGGGYGQSNWAYGIGITNATIQTNGTGTITLTGQGGSGGNYSQAGIFINGGTITTVNGALTLTGTGYGTNNDPGGGSNLSNQVSGGYGGTGNSVGQRTGIEFLGATNLVDTTGTGNVVLAGGASASSGWNHGMVLGGSSGGSTTTIQATGGGSITINATQTNNDWAFDNGAVNTNITRITTSGGATAGNITINATSAANEAVDLRGDVQITSTNAGNIALTGTSGGSGITVMYLHTDNGSVAKNFIISTTGAGTVSVAGTSSGANGHGIYSDGIGTLDLHTVSGALNLHGIATGSGYQGLGLNATNTALYSTSGAVTVDGASTNGYGIYATGTNLNIGTNGSAITTTGAVTVGVSGAEIGSISFNNTNTTIKNAGTADIAITGVGRTGGSGNAQGIEWSTSGTLLVTTTANLNITGTSSQSDAMAIYGAGSHTFSATNGGNIAITASTTCNCQGFYTSNSGSNLSILTSGGSTAGAITITGTGARGIYLVDAPTIASTNAGVITLTGNANVGGYEAIHWNTPTSHTTTISTTGAGTITVTGTAQVGNNHAVYTDGAGTTLIKTASGAIAIRGVAASGGYIGVYLGEATNNVYSTSGAISITGVAPSASYQAVQTSGVTRIGTDGASVTTSGDITIGTTGTDQGGVYFGGTSNTIKTTGNIAVASNAPSGQVGLQVQGSSSNTFYTPTGNITLTGITGGSATGTAAMNFHGSAPTYVGWDGTSAGTTGNNSILGQTSISSSAGQGGISFGNAQIKGSGALLIGNTNTAGAALSGFTLNASGNATGSNYTSVTLGTNGAGTTGSIYDYASFTTQAAGAISVKGTGNIWIDGATLNSSGAALTVQSTVEGYIQLLNSPSLISGGGNITVSNYDLVNTGTYAIYMSGSGTVINAGGSNLSISGKVSYNSAGLSGIYISGSSKIYTSGTGTVSLTGYGNAVSNQAIRIDNGTNYIGWDGASTVTAGAITVLGQTSSGNTRTDAVTLSNAVFKPNGNDIVIGSTGLGNGGGITLGATTFASGNWKTVNIGDAGTGSITINGTSIATNTATTGVINVRADGTYNGVAGLGNITIQSNATVTAANAPITVQGTGNVQLDGASTLVSSGGGAINVKSTTNGYVYLTNSASLTSNGGAITISNNDATASVHGIYFTGAAGSIDASKTGGGGTVTISGKVSSAAGYTAVFLNGSTKVFTGGTAPVTITGHANSTNSYAIQSTTGVNYVGWNGSTISTSGAITLASDSLSGNANFWITNLQNVTLKPNGQALTIGSTGNGLYSMYLGNIFGSGNWGAVNIGDANTAYVYLTGGTINTNNAAINIQALGGGANNTGVGTVYMADTLQSNGGNITIVNSAGGGINQQAGVWIVSNAVVNAGGGNVTITGYGGGSSGWGTGVWIDPSTITTTTGSITITGTGTNVAGKTNNDGITFGGSGTQSIYTTSGNIVLTGTSGTGSVTSYSAAIDNLSNGTLKIYSTSGNLTLTGRSQYSGGYSAVYLSGAGANTPITYVGHDGASAGTSGNISILGETSYTSSNTSGIVLGNQGTFSVKGSGALLVGNAVPTSISTALSQTLSGLQLNSAFVASGANFSSVTIGTNGTGTTGQVYDYASFTTQAGGAISVIARNNLTLNGAILNSNGGALTVQSAVDGYVYLINNASLISGGGNITISNNDATTAGHGVYFTGASGSVDASKTGSNGGAITITGKTSTAGGYTAVLFGGTTKVFSSGTGTIAITGCGNSLNDYAVYDNGGANYIGWNNGATVQTGAITILGETAPATTLTNAIGLTGTVFKPNGQNITIGSTSRGVSGITLAAATLSSGSWNNITIGDANTTYVNLGGAALNAGGTGAISANAGGLYNGTGGGGSIVTGVATLTTAGGTISLLTGNASPTLTTVGININGAANFQSNGGNITLGGTGAGPAGNLYAYGANGPGIVTVSGATFNSGAGAIKLYGKVNVANDDGIRFVGTTLMATTGAITLDGVSYSSASTFHGIDFSSGTSSITTTTGAISATGMVGNASGAAASHGISVNGGTASLTSTSGAITLTGSRFASSAASYGLNIAAGASLYVGAPASATPVDAGAINIYADTINYAGTLFQVRSTGALTVAPITASTTIGIGGGAGTLALLASWFSGGTRVFQDSFSSMTIGSLTGTGAITMNATTFTDPVNLLSAASGGSLTVNGASVVNNAATQGDFSARVGSNVTLAAGSSITTSSTNSNIVLSTEGIGAFQNNSGSATPLSVGSGGRWLVYSSSPGTTGTPITIFGASPMNSNNPAIWGKTYTAAAPASIASGNRYVFNVNPTVTITTASASKVYGNDATATVAMQYTTGITNATNNGSGTAYTAPVATDAVNGTTDFTVTSLGASATANAGTYAVNFSATPAVLSTGFNATYAATGVETVNPAPLTIGPNAGQIKQYGDDDPLSAKTAYSVTSGALQNSDTLTGNMGRALGETVGTYAFTQGTTTVNDGNGSNNYTITFNGATNKFSITPRTLTVTVAPTKVYGADDPAIAGIGLALNAVNRTVIDINGTVTAINDTLAANLATTLLTLTRTASAVTELVGTQAISGATFGAVTGTATANYSAPTLGASNITITVAPLNATLPNQAKVYGANDPATSGITVTLAPINRTVTVFGGGAVAINDTGNVSALATGLTRAVGENVGTYNITGVALSTPTGSAAGNYSSTATVTGTSTLAITKANLTGTIANQTKTYGADDPALAGITPVMAGVNRTVSTWNGSVTVDDSAVASLSAPVSSLTRATGEAVGAHNITAGTFGTLTGTSAGNYNAASFAGTPTLTINPAALTASVANQTKVYGANDPALSGITPVLTGLVNRSVLTWNSAVTIPINDSALVATTATGLVRAAGENTGAYNITGASFAALTGTSAGNYLATTFLGTPTLTITPVTLTATVPNQTKVYGTSDPSVAGIAPTLSGAVTGVTVTNWMGGATAVNDSPTTMLTGLTRMAGENVGSYAVVGASFGTLASTGAANYIAPTLAGSPVLAIAPAPLTASIPSQGKIYGDDDPLPTGIPVTLGGLVNRTVSTWNGNISINDTGNVAAALASLMRQNGEGVGSRTITGATFNALTGSAAGNYSTPNLAGGPTLAITAAPLTVTSVTRTYDGTTAVAGSNVGVSGAVNRIVATWNGNVAVSDGVSVTYTGGSFDNRNAGTGKAVTLNNVSLAGTGFANYTLFGLNGGNYTASTGAVNRAPLVVTAATSTKLYDGNTSAAAVPVVTGLASADTATANETYDTPSVGTGKTLSPAVTINDGNGGANYTLAYVVNTSGVITGSSGTGGTGSSGGSGSSGVGSATTGSTIQNMQLPGILQQTESVGSDEGMGAAGRRRIGAAERRADLIGESLTQAGVMAEARYGDGSARSVMIGTVSPNAVTFFDIGKTGGSASLAFPVLGTGGVAGQFSVQVQGERVTVTSVPAAKNIAPPAALPAPPSFERMTLARSVFGDAEFGFGFTEGTLYIESLSGAGDRALAGGEQNLKLLVGLAATDAVSRFADARSGIKAVRVMRSRPVARGNVQ